MTRDLTDLMHTSVAAREQSIAELRPSPAALADVGRRVRRKRAARHTFQSVGAGLVAVVLAGASWFGLRGHEAPEPAHTPTPSVSPSPSVTPTPTVAPVVLDEIPGLPPTQAMPPGLLERTGPGWVLTIYRSAPPAPDGCDEPACAELPGALQHTVVLVSPTGERYRVVDLPHDTAVSLLHWDARATTAVVSIDWVGDIGAGGEARAELDLTTGTLTPTDLGLGSFNGGPSFVGVAADGAELWSIGTSTDSYTSDVYRRADDGSVELVGGIGSVALLDPTGQRLVTRFEDDDLLVILDVVNGDRNEVEYGLPGKACGVVGWIDASSLLARCQDPVRGEAFFGYLNATLYRVDVADGSAHATELKQYAEDDTSVPEIWRGATLADGRVVFPMVARDTSMSLVGVSVWDGAAVVPLVACADRYFYTAAIGADVYVQATPSCDGGQTADLTVHHLTSGSSLVLAPVPAASADGVEWETALWSWAIAGARLPYFG